MSPRRPLRALRAGGLAIVLAALGAGSAQAAPSGPALDVPQAQLDGALQCSAAFDATAGEPILLIPGTGARPAENFDLSWTPELDRQHRRWCTIELPDAATGDIQVAAAYVTNAIRAMSARTGGGKVAMVGHSQGGMVGRWSLKWWPDTRALVSDYVSVAGSNHGTTLADTACGAMGSCTPANWQQASKSKFLAALNDSAETYSGIAYTDVYTPADEVVQPNADDVSGSTSLRTGRGDIANIDLTSVCATDTSEHLLVGSVDNTAFRLALDAVDREGPADAAAVRDGLARTGTCQAGNALTGANAIPGVSPATVAQLSSLYLANPSAASVPAEPALKDYVRAGAAPDAADVPPTAPPTTPTTPTAPPLPLPAPGVSPAPAAPTGTAPTSPAAAAAGRVASRLSASLARTRDRSAPFAYVLRGRLAARTGATPAGACSGTVTVRVKTAAGTTVSSRRSEVSSSCAFSSRVTFRAARRLGRSGRLSFRASFGGNAALRASSATAVRGRVG